MLKFKEFNNELNEMKLSKTEQAIMDELAEYNKYSISYESGSDGWGGKVSTKTRTRNALENLIKKKLIKLKGEYFSSVNRKNFKGVGILNNYELMKGN